MLGGNLFQFGQAIKKEVPLFSFGAAQPEEGWLWSLAGRSVESWQVLVPVSIPVSWGLLLALLHLPGCTLGTCIPLAQGSSRGQTLKIKMLWLPI